MPPERGGQSGKDRPDREAELSVGRKGGAAGQPGHVPRAESGVYQGKLTT